jgi:hypothetical protein
MSTYVLLRVLHITIAATWLGVTLGGAGQVKRALAAGPGLFAQATREVQRRRWLSFIMGVLTVVTGVILILDNPEGFKGVHKNIHMALGIAVVKVGFGFAILKTTVKKLVSVGEKAAGESELPSRAGDGVRRLAMLSGIDDLLWLVLLTLMYWR